MVGQYIDFLKKSSTFLSWERLTNVTVTNLYHDYNTFKDNVTWVDIYSMGLAVYVIMTIRRLVEWRIKVIQIYTNMIRSSQNLY